MEKSPAITFSFLVQRVIGRLI